MREITLHQSTNDNDFNKKFTILAVGEKNPVTGAHNHYVVGGVAPQGVRDFEGQTGASILFQNGRPDDNLGPNGFSMEVLLAIVADRLDAFQTGQFPHPCNDIASKKIKGAIEALHYRSAMVDQDSDMTQEMMDSYCALLMKQAMEHGLSLNFPVGSTFEFENGRMVTNRGDAADTINNLANGTTQALGVNLYDNSEFRSRIERNGKPTVSLVGVNSVEEAYAALSLIGPVGVVVLSEAADDAERTAIMGVAERLFLHHGWPSCDDQELIDGITQHEFIAVLPNVGIVASSAEMAQKFILATPVEKRTPFQQVYMLNNDGSMGRSAYCNTVGVAGFETKISAPRVQAPSAEEVEEAGPQPTAVEGVRVVAVYNEHTKHNFVDADIIEPITVEVANEHSVLTAPFKFGQRFSLLSISEAPELLEVGAIDQTDSLDAAVSVETVYVSLTGTLNGQERTETFGFVVGAGEATQPGSTAGCSEVYGKLAINTVFSLEVYNGVLQLNAQPSELLAAMSRVEDPSMYIQLHVFGDIDLNTGAIIVDAKIKTEPVEAGPDFVYEGSFRELECKAVPLGYELLSHRVNYNRSPRG